MLGSGKRIFNYFSRVGLRVIFYFTIIGGIILPDASQAELSLKSQAPSFELMNQNGQMIRLDSFKDKTVVLEWLNHGCPFVRKHYDSGNMQKLQKKWAKRDVVWLSIISSAPGKQGHVDGAQALKDKQSNESGASHILLDPTGAVGKLYGAKTTPHMYILDKGVVVYQGAIDDRASTDAQDITEAKNYIDLALEELSSGKAIGIPETRAYGCSVKY